MKVFILLVLGIWIGLVLGLSFLEAPLKFRAPGMTTKLGVGIGRLVFGYSNKIQLGLMIVVTIGLLFNSTNSSVIFKILFLIVCATLTIQTFYLLPILDIRATKILNDETITSSHHHLYFVTLEIIKVIALISFFISLYHHE